MFERIFQINLQFWRFFCLAPYVKNENTTCPDENIYDSYDNLDEAKTACNNDPMCKVIVNEPCDEMTFKLCNVSVPQDKLPTSNKSCTHIKIFGKKTSNVINCNRNMISPKSIDISVIITLIILIFQSCLFLRMK